MKRFICLMLALILLLSLIPAASAQTAVQTDICLTPGADQSQMNFTWYAADAAGGTLLLAKLEDVQDSQMPADAAAFQATVVKANDGDNYSHQVTATGLEPGTDYAYQLVNGADRSDIMTFATAASGAFSFAYVGDPQIGGGDLESDIEGWANTLQIITEDVIFADTAFLLTAGDHVNKAANESQYDGLLHHEALQSLPIAPSIGNHDSDSNAFSQHFNLPNESTTYGVTDAGGNAWFVYNNVLFLLLNSNDTASEEHKAFMEAAIAANPDVIWKIVVLHHSLYTVAKHASDKKILSRRAELAPIFQELDIDIVLMGHDHVYCRTYLMDGLEPVTDTALYDDKHYSAATAPDGVLYLTANSGSGSKTYDCKDESFAYAAVQNQEHVSNVSRFSVSDEALTITTYRTSDMSIVDSFTIYRIPEVTLPFTDVDAGDWFFQSVQYTYAYGLISGMTRTSFGPEITTTRGMFVTLLYRMEGAPEIGTVSFSDVRPGQYYTDAVAWAAANGIVSGYGNDCFGPQDTITREQMVAILQRYADYKGYDTNTDSQLSGFTDADDISAYAVNAMNWAVEEGLIVGMSSNKLVPTGNASRAQVAAIIMRLRKLLTS